MDLSLSEDVRDASVSTETGLAGDCVVGGAVACAAADGAGVDSRGPGMLAGGANWALEELELELFRCVGAAGSAGCGGAAAGATTAVFCGATGA